MPHRAQLSMHTFWEGNEEREERTPATKNVYEDRYAWILFYNIL